MMQGSFKVLHYKSLYGISHNFYQGSGFETYTLPHEIYCTHVDSFMIGLGVRKEAQILDKSRSLWPIIFG